MGGEFLQVKESAKGGENGHLLPDERTRTLAVVAASGKPADKLEETVDGTNAGEARPAGTGANARRQPRG